jgi:hypothetical protein
VNPNPYAPPDAPPRKRTPWWRTLLYWVVGIVLFLAFYQWLQPREYTPEELRQRRQQWLAEHPDAAKP